MKNYIFFVLILSLVGCSSCRKDCQQDYRFQIPYTLFPQIDTFFIGDTIWVEAEYSNELVDLNSNQEYTINKFDFISELFIGKIDTEPFEDATFEFNVIEKKGQLSLIQLLNASGYQITYQIEEDKHIVEFGLVPTKEGLFEFVLTSTIPNEFHESVFTKNCTETISIDYLLNDGFNNNYEFIQLSQDSSIRTTTKEIFNAYGSYCFYVVE